MSRKQVKGSSSNTANARVNKLSAGVRASPSHPTSGGRVPSREKESGVCGEHNVSTNSDLRSHDKRFPFMSLAAELRLRIYAMVLGVSKDRLVDLDPQNYRTLHPILLSLFLVSRRIHEEASELFYGKQTIQLFPQHGRFFHTALPLLARLPAHYRNVVTSVQLRLGPGWSSPPRCQRITTSLGTEDCTNLRRLKLFVECDPSDAIFAGFRGKGATENTYRDFCVALLHDLFAQVESLEIVEIDAYPSVKKEGRLLTVLKRTIEEEGRKIIWGQGIRDRELGRGGGGMRMEELAGAFGSLSLGSPPPGPNVGRLVEVHA